MTRHVLILSANLSGLITAYRLIHYGFQVTILEQQQHVAHGGSAASHAESTISGNALSPDSPRDHGLPLILYGFYHSTWSLLQELSICPNSDTLQQVDLEFGTSGNRTITLPGSRWLSAFHPIIRLALFGGLSWSDRWHLINFLEKKWEGHFSPDHNPDTLTVESWLLAAGQSTPALNTIWNPLCRLLVGCDATQASLGYFLEVLTRHWLSPSNGPETFLASSNLLDLLHQELKRVLVAKSVQFFSSAPITHIQADTNGLQFIALANEERLTADAYVSPLSPFDLLNLLPERAPARFSSFSYLTHLQEVAGTAVRATLTGTRLPPRLLLNSGLFDWITSQTTSGAQGLQTTFTGITFHPSSSHTPTDDWLTDTAWPHIQHVFQIFPETHHLPHQPRVTQSGFTILPCQAGFRTFRPLSETPIPNLFLAGPWTSTQLPPSLESTVISANACASSLAKFVQGASH